MHLADGVEAPHLTPTNWWGRSHLYPHIGPWAHMGPNGHTWAHGPYGPSRANGWTTWAHMNPIGPMGKMGPSATCAHICLYGPMGLMRPHGPMYVNKFTHICEFNGGPNRNLNTPADSIGSQTHPLYSTITEGIAEMQEQLEAHRSLLREGRRAFMARESALTDAERRMYLDPS